MLNGPFSVCLPLNWKSVSTDRTERRCWFHVLPKNVGRLWVSLFAEQITLKLILRRFFQLRQQNMFYL